MISSVSRITALLKILGLFLILNFSPMGCFSDRTTQEYEPEEANIVIALAHAAKDHECGTLHMMTLPIMHQADKKNVDFCVAEIMSTQCSDWAADSHIPASCLAIQVGL